MSIVTVIAAGSRVFLSPSGSTTHPRLHAFRSLSLFFVFSKSSFSLGCFPVLMLRLALSSCSHTPHCHTRTTFSHHLSHGLPVGLLSPTASLMELAISNHSSLLATPVSQNFLLEIFVEGYPLQSSPLAVHDHDHLRPQLFCVSRSRRSLSSWVLPTHRF